MEGMENDKMNENDIPDELKGVAGQYQKDIESIKEQVRTEDEHNDQCMKDTKSGKSTDFSNVGLDNSEPAKIRDDNVEEELLDVNIRISDHLKRMNQVAFWKIKKEIEAEREKRNDIENKYYNYNEYSAEILNYMSDFEGVDYKNYLELVAKASDFRTMVPPSLVLTGKKTEQVKFKIEKEYKNSVGVRMELFFIDPNFSLLLSACFVRMVFDRDDLVDFRDDLEADNKIINKYIENSNIFYNDFFEMFFEKVFKFDYLMSRKNGPVFDYMHEVFEMFEKNNKFLDKYLDKSMEFCEKVISNKVLEFSDFYFEKNHIKLVNLSILLGQINKRRENKQVSQK